MKIMFRCCHCKEEKTEESFYKDKHKPSGYKPRCKLCESLSMDKRREEYLQNKHVDIVKKCYMCKEEKECALFYTSKETYDGLQTKCIVCSKKYIKENKDKVNKASAKWRKNNPHKMKAARDNYYKNNPDKFSESLARYRKKNKGKIGAHKARVRVDKFNAMPSWANEKYIQLFYKLAGIEKERTGKAVHVDHIIPLRGKTVCGLHVEHNLQLMFAKDNILKGNRHWPDMWQ